MTRIRLHIVIVLAALTGMKPAKAQEVTPIEVLSNSLNTKGLPQNWADYAEKKTLPVGYEEEALTALSHFPELKNVKVKFKIKESYSTLKTKPSFFSMLAPRGHRTYIITISSKSIDKLTPILLENLPNDARIGVIGHELSHVVDFSSKTVWQSIKIAFGHLSPSYLDKFEYNTDLICIRHGLGTELAAWSSYIRDTMHTVYWRGSDYVNKGDSKYERYMNPDTIEKHMAQETK